MIERLFGKHENIVDLFPLNSREPFQELVDSRTSVQMLEQRGHRQPRPTETPYSAELFRVPIDGATATPVHTYSVFSIERLPHGELSIEFSTCLLPLPHQIERRPDRHPLHHLQPGLRHPLRPPLLAPEPVKQAQDFAALKT